MILKVHLPETEVALPIIEVGSLIAENGTVGMTITSYSFKTAS